MVGPRIHAISLIFCDERVPWKHDDFSCIEHYGLMWCAGYGTGTAAENVAPNTERQVLFRTGEGDYVGYRIPSLLVTNTPQTVLVFAEARQAFDGFGVPSPDGVVTEIVMRRSVNGDRTWSKRQVVINSENVTTANPCAVLDRQAGTVF